MMDVMIKTVLVLVIVVFIDDAFACSSFQRNWRRPFAGSCSRGHYSYSGCKACYDSKTIKGMTGRWDMYCADNPKCKAITFSSVHNNNDTGEMNYICPHGGYIRGIHRILNYRVYGNLRYNISCCHDNKTESHTDCYWVGWQNCFGQPFKFWVPDGYYMAGIKTKYNSSIGKKPNSYNWNFLPYARIWDFYVCT